jgi:hypothetical protein
MNKFKINIMIIGLSLNLIGCISTRRIQPKLLTTIATVVEVNYEKKFVELRWEPASPSECFQESRHLIASFPEENIGEMLIDYNNNFEQHLLSSDAVVVEVNYEKKFVELRWECTSHAKNCFQESGHPIDSFLEAEVGQVFSLESNTKTSYKLVLNEILTEKILKK